MNVDEVCQTLGITRSLVYRRLREGRLTMQEQGGSGRRGRGVKITEESVRAYEIARLAEAERRTSALRSLAHLEADHA